MKTHTNNISTIIFDLSEVYLKGLLGTHILISKEISESVSMDALNIPEQLQLFAGKISEEEFWTAVLKRNKWPLTVGDLINLVRDNFQEIEGTRNVIESLQSQGYNLGLLSIHAKEWVDYLESKFNYHKLFNQISYSYYPWSKMKPDLLAYQDILKKMDSSPERSVFIDDIELNLFPAKKLGMQTIQFQSVERLISDLETSGVSIEESD
ncbi:MAG: HAD-IA family hydrolase [bacterium]|nr:HAD-IA family hydrolase [bacterium]